MKQFLFVPILALFVCMPASLSSHESIGDTFAGTDAGMREARLPQAGHQNICGDSGDCALDADLPEPRKTTIVPPALAVRPDILDAIQRASNFIGVDYEYLLRVAFLESSYNEATEAKTSTAVGLFQFIERTWLFMMREIAFEFGIDDVAAAIVADEDGGYSVPDPEQREKILRLRYDPAISAIIAAEFTRRNAEHMTRQLGRELRPGELYVAHFFGPRAAVRLIGLMESDPRSRANQHFPQAARANRTIFYRKREPRTVAEVYEVLVGKYQNIPIYAQEAPQSMEAAVEN